MKCFRRILSVLLLITVMFVLCPEIGAKGIEIGYIGDVDGNKTIDICDATVIQKYLIYKEKLDYSEIYLADVNGDNSVNVRDVTYLQLHLINKIKDYAENINGFSIGQLVTTENSTFYTVDTVPEYNGDAIVEVNNNFPYFTSKEKYTCSFENYSPLDEYGRCGVAFACVGQDIMPTEDRGSISSVKPTGWHSVVYDVVDGGYLYNRCHLIGWQLTGENANEKNLITGTRYMNVQGMLPYENAVAQYIKSTDNHVMYRATPVFKEDNMLADGVLIEAYSVEDSGEGICFNVYCYNVQPAVIIDYKTGDSKLDENFTDSEDSVISYGALKAGKYILNTKSKKIHKESCTSASSISAVNKGVHIGSVEKLVDGGYTPCGICVKKLEIVKVSAEKKVIHNIDCSDITSDCVSYVGLTDLLLENGYALCDAT